MRSVVLLALSLACATAARADPACAPIDQALASVMATEQRARADATDALRCHFPAGMTFRDAAILLDRNGFDMLNEVEQSFWIFDVRGREYLSKRIVAAGRTTAEFRIVIHIENDRIVRFAAQYFAITK
jgi:hypothetical protein